MSSGPAWPEAALADAAPVAFWLDDPSRPGPLAPLEGVMEADLLVVGGGFAGLWAALRAKERDPSRSVVLLEAARIGHAATGRNGGFVDPSLTHGFENGHARWPQDTTVLLRLALENLDGIEETVRRFDIDCALERSGALGVATRPHEVDELTRLSIELEAAGAPSRLLGRDEVRQRVDSPTYLAGLWDPCVAMVEPARLAWGLLDACRRLGVQVHEGTPASNLRRDAGGVRVDTPAGSVRAGQAVLATNAFPSLLRRLHLLTVPVYDYALMTEPLTAQQRAAIGWRGREGIGDLGNQFHYYRLTRDDRILFGGYDAVYHYGSGIDPAHYQRPETFRLLAEHLAQTFPVLEGIRFSHRWGGVIDTSARFCAFYGRALGGRVGYAAGYTGLGVASTRFAADVVLDLLAGADTERTRLAMVRERPVPFPPEPVRWAGVQATRWSLARSDAHGGRRNLWLRATDALGLGFDS
jgi:glycine/D-amino acid oxidase-like deaminating enzyme